mmetsp:Transcript_47629/g.112087  ORF Transcript_47629/g.112087 Transcript_47629/m.112087 type:complete len:138 (-) Transcript_47629:21-434(-)
MMLASTSAATAFACNPRFRVVSNAVSNNLSSSTSSVRNAESSASRDIVRHPLSTCCCTKHFAQVTTSQLKQKLRRMSAGCTASSLVGTQRGLVSFSCGCLRAPRRSVHVYAFRVAVLNRTHVVVDLDPGLHIINITP